MTCTGQYGSVVRCLGLEGSELFQARRPVDRLPDEVGSPTASATIAAARAYRSASSCRDGVTSRPTAIPTTRNPTFHLASSPTPTLRPVAATSVRACCRAGARRIQRQRPRAEKSRIVVVRRWPAARYSLEEAQATAASMRPTGPAPRRPAMAAVVSTSSPRQSAGTTATRRWTGRRRSTRGVRAGGQEAAGRRNRRRGAGRRR